MTIRPMTPADVAPAAQTILDGGWGDRRAFFEFAVGHPACRPLVATLDDEVVATGVGTVSGPVGWVGTVFVDRGQRRRGLGLAITNAVVDSLHDAGCRTLVLVATEAGRPLYERIGFELQSWYHTLEAPGIDPSTAPADPRLRPFAPADLDPIALLDAHASGEDRRHLLAAFATRASARVLAGGGDERRLRGFVVRAPWGGGATVAVEVDDAVAILDARRLAAGPHRRVRAGVLEENEAGLERLRSLGWSEVWSAPRLVRGEPMRWHPEHLWGQFNHALG